MGTKINPVVRLIKTITFNGLESLNNYYSRYRAFVYDNDDPEKMGRLMLIIPQITGNDYYEYWAYPCNVFSGPGYGSQVIPQKTDMVWVEFEGGKPEVPIWSHGHFAKGEMPDDSEMQDINCYWFQTPGGNKVKLNDTKKTIHIESSLGDIVEINPDSISLVTDKKISFGSLNQSEYHAVLGEENKMVLNEIQAYLQEFSIALNADLISSLGSPYLKKTNLASKGFPLLKRAIGLKAKIERILSDRVTLDK